MKGDLLFTINWIPNASDRVCCLRQFQRHSWYLSIRLSLKNLREVFKLALLCCWHFGENFNTRPIHHLSAPYDLRARNLWNWGDAACPFNVWWVADSYCSIGCILTLAFNEYLQRFKTFINPISLDIYPFFWSFNCWFDFLNQRYTIHVYVWMEMNFNWIKLSYISFCKKY